MLQDSAFTGGRIVMPQNPEQLLHAAAWSDAPMIRIAIAASVIVLLLAVRSLVRIFPDILDAVSRWKGNISLEHNLSIARTRDRIAFAFLLPFCLIADRFGFYRPAFLDFIPGGLSLLGVVGACLAYILLRALVFMFWHPSGVDHDHRLASHRALYNIFIFFCILMLLTVGAFVVFGIDESVVRYILLGETGLVFLVFWIRFMQILKGRCTGLATFLYLCALEFAPLGLLVTSALLF